MMWRNFLERTRFSIESALEAFRQAALLHDPARSTRSTPLQFGELEARVLMSATPLPPELLEAAVGNAPDAAGLDASPYLDQQTTDASATADGQALDQDTLNGPTANDEGQSGSSATGSSDRSAHDGTSQSPETSVRRTVIFVDDSANPDALTQLLADTASDSDREVVRLTADEDGVAFIGDLLTARDHVASVHILSTGADGAVKLGGAWLTVDNLPAYATELTCWQDGLTGDAAIQFHVSELATSENGPLLLEAVQELTGAETQLVPQNLSSSPADGERTALGDGASQAQTGADVVLLDSQLDDYELLRQAVLPQSQLFVYDSSSDSASSILTRVSAWSEATGTQIASLSILSHGTEGAFELGNEWISTSSLDSHSEDWRRLSYQLVAGANIHIFSCDVAAIDSDGQLLLDELAQVTGADVFASTNATGGEGDWLLEASSRSAAAELANGWQLPLSAQYLAETNASLGWYSTSWSNRKSVTINHSQVSGGANLTNFPVLISVTDTNFRTTTYGGHVAQSDGGDFVFTSADGTTKLDHQIESYDPVTGKLVAWVEVPSVSYASDTALYIYYGNSAASNQWNTTGTWESNFKGVWHLGSDYTDSTSNANTGSNVGASNYSTAKIGDGEDFNGTSSYVTTTSSEAQSANNFTISLWFNADSTAFAQHLLWQGVIDGNGYGGGGSTQQEMHISIGNHDGTTAASDVLSFFLGDETSGVTNPLNIVTPMTDTTGWHHVTVVVSNMSTTPTATMYLDGVSVGTDTGALSDTSRASWDTDLRFGRPGPSERYYNGGLDEVRLATTNRTAGWVTTEYNNQNSPGTFVTFGSEDDSVNNAPVNSVPGAQTMNEDTTKVFSSGNGNLISVTDVDAGYSAIQITLTGTNGTVTLSGTSGLSFSVGDGTADAAMTFTGLVSDINTALAGLSFSATSNFSGSANLQIVTNDLGNSGSGGAKSDTDNVAITVNAVNDVPTFSASTGTLPYPENYGPYAIGSTVTISDIDSADFNGGQLVFHITANGLAEDKLTVRHDGTGAGQVGVSGADITYGGVVVGTFNGPVTGGTALTVTFNASATPAIAQAVARNVTYENTSDSPSTVTRTLQAYVTDGDGGTSGTITGYIQPAPSNDAPANAVPGSQTTAVNSPLVFSTTNANGISISDVDASSGAVRVTLTATNGAVTLSGLAGLSFTSGDGTADATMTFTGTVTNINTALNGLTFTPGTDFQGSASLQIIVNDQGNTGSGGALSDTDTITIEVLSRKFQEGVGSYTGTEDTELLSGTADTAYGGNASISIDLDNGGLGISQGLLRFDNLFGSGASQIPYGATIHSASLVVYVTDPGATGAQISLHRMLTNWSESSTWNTVTAGIQANDIEALTVADSVLGTPTATGFQTFTGLESAVQSWADGATNLGWAVLIDSTNGWDFASSEYSTAALRPALVINFTPPQPASIDLDANNSSAATGAHYNASWTEDGGAVAIVDSDATITDSDDAQLNALTVTISNLLDGAAEVLAANTSGTSISAAYDSGTGTLTLSGADSVAHYEQVLRTVTYHNSSQNPNTTTRSVTFVANDGFVNSNTATTTLTINAVNDAPAITSNGGGASAGISLAENQTDVTTVNSTDFDGGTAAYSIVAGQDGALFTIDSGSGALRFASAPNREFATDGDANHVYVVTVQVSDGNGGTDTQQISVTITDVDEFDVTAPSDANGTANAVNENAANGTAVGVTASASDADATTNGVTYSLTDNAGGRFAIDANTGIVTVADGSLLNREAASSHDITVRATSADGSTADTTFTIQVTDVDEFDVTAPADANAAANAVNENAANGTAVGVTASASDADATTNGVTYSLTDTAGGRFAIDANTGIVTVADGSLLNREAAASHDITARATSADGSTADTTFTIQVNDVDEFNVTAPADSNAAANAVNENAANGTAVGITAAANDADATTNGVTFSLADDAGGRFTIDTSTGIVTVANGSLLNREAIASHDITVRATSADGSTADTTFTIQVNDVDEFDVTAPADSNAAANAVNENAANGTAVGITAAANDADATTNGVTFALTDDAGGRFTIDANTGIVTVADGSLLNREAAASHDITVRATSADGSTADTTFTIQVNDVDEFDVSAPADSNAAANAVNENAANGTAVGVTASASDTDATTNGVTFSLTDDAGGRFTIDANTGVVTVADGSLLNREAASSHDITVRATSADGSTADTTFTIQVNDVDEFNVTSPADANGTANAVNENAANGTAVGITAAANDADATTNGVTFALTDDAGGRFTIDANTGIVTVADGSLLNREAAASHDITVRATSADGSTADTIFTIQVNDVDEFDVTAPSDVTGTANAVNENAANGTAVGITAAANDSDATTNGVTFSLTDDAGGRFTVDTNTGVVTVADGSLLNRESASSHDITVRATSADGSTADTTFTIQVNDVDEFDVTAPSDANAAANAVNENAANGTAVGVTASASDADATTNGVTFSLTDDAGGRFAIDANTGIVTVADGSLLNCEAIASHDITVRATSADGSSADNTFTINVNDVDEFDVTAPSDVNAAANAVNENAANGTAVGVTASASDADATTNGVTFSLADDAGGRFTIDTSTGIVTVANGSLLNREAIASHDITVRATSADGSTADTTFTIQVNDVDEFDVSAPTDVNAAANAVNESAVNGTAVGITASASDADATTNGVTFSLTDSAGGRFAIDANTGIVTVADGSLLNREATASHDITVRATSADGSIADTTFTIQVNDVDEFDVTAPSDANAAVNAVNENAVNGTGVGVTASASDADATTNGVTFSLTDDAGGRFTIDTSTGIVTVADGSLLNREAASSHDITVRATSADGSIADTTFTIQVNDVDEFDVTAPSDGNAAANAVNENAVNGTGVGVTASASDADAATNGVTFSLTDDAGGRFTIDTSTGIVTVADGSLLNREAASSHDITVRATSADGSTADTTFTIQVNDVDEFNVTSPADANGTANAVNENAANGTAVGITAAASDADATTNGVSFSLTDDAGGRFAIDTSTGIVTVADGSLLNREAIASHDITVRATSADGSTADTTFTIQVNDVDEFDVTAPSDVNAAANAVNENAINGTAVGITVSASDADATTNGVTFSLTDDAGGRFTIDTSTGIVTVADGSLLNREAAASHDITVRATSADGSTADTIFTIQVNDVDEFDVTAPSDVTGTANAVNENAANGTAVGITAAANDADATTNGVTFSLTDDAGGRFTIDTNSGVVTVADGSLLNRESASSHDITVRATSADGSTADTTFTIQVNDVDEFNVTAPADSNAAANAVNENATNGTTVGVTATASDADATTNGVTFALTDDAGGRFTIDANTGIVTVADGSLLNREAASSHDITVRATSADGSTADTTFTIQVNDVDEFDVTAPSDVNAAANAVNENATNGTTVGVTATASDADATTNGVTFALTDDAGGRFTIDANTGIVTVADGSLLNREAASSHDITVRATSADGSTADTTFTIQVNDVDEFDVTAPSDVNAAANAVNENAANGTAVGVTVSASDADATTNGVTFSLTDDAGGRFTIDTSTGIVTVADGSLLNREAASSHDITVRATSADGSTADNTFTINVNDVDEFDVTAPSDVNAAANAVNENAANGTAVGVTVSASDADATTNGVTFALTDDAGGRFTIDANTGIVTVADGLLLNREAASSHDITVRATSADGSTADTTFTIQVNDVDEFDVTAPSDGNAAANAVNENAANGTAVGVTVSASDADATTNGVTFSLTDDAGGRFTVDTSTGIVTVADGSLLNREAASSHDITVRATSADGSTADTTFTIQVNDVDEFDVTAPADANAAANAVNENAANGTAVSITATASDADATTNGVTFSLTDDAGGRFTIDANTGIVTVADGSLLNREAAASHDITVRATSADGSTADTTFTIQVNDVDEFNVTAPADSNAAANAVNENAANGTTVGITAMANDADATTNGVTFSLTDDAGGRFTIDTNSGVVTVADGSLLNREAASSHDITVRATSADGSIADTTFTIQVNDVDEFDVTAPSDVTGTANAVNENAANGTAVGITASANDADATTNGVTFSLTDDAGGRFTIDTNSGVVTVADGSLLNRESASSHDITVRATSADGSTADTTFTIQVNDVDEFDVTAPSDVNAAANAVNENAINGTAVGVTASASDADATTNGVTFSLTDDAGGRFTIDTSTGIVTVADGSLLNREAASSHDITVRATSADGSTADTTFTIQVNDVDEFDVTAPSDVNAAANAVNENAANGTAVGVTVSASDADATTNGVTFALTDDAGGRFTIDANTGIVTVADGSLLNREAASSHDITVRATSADGSTADTTFTIQVNDVDEFDVTAPSDVNAAANAVNENAANGTAVGVTVSASDADATTNGVTFSLTDDAGGRFTIDTSTGIVTVADGSLLNREAASSHDITVRATSADGSTADNTFTINVNDVDEFDVTAPADANAAANAVNENAANGTAVSITATASDADATTNGITFALTDDAGGRFTIDANTGIVTVADGSLLNREAAASHDITVRATSADGSTADTTFTIQVNDVDEFDVTAPADADGTANAVNENAANGTTVGVTATASDADATTNGVTFALTDDAGGRFTIDANTGIVTVADGSLLNREAASSHDITVRATSADGSTADTTFTIQVNDVDEFNVTAPADANAAANAVNENAANGTAVGVTATASDADATANGVTYSLTDDAGGRFAIDTSTGIVTVADGSLLNREAASSHDITVRATSADGSTADTTFTIQVNDVDEFNVTAPADANAAANAVNENAANGTAVGVTATASDADATANGVTYSLTDDAGGRFAIDTSTGIVTVADGSLLNREAASSHDITVRAMSADGSIADTTFTIQVNDVYEFDVTAPSDGNAAANAVNENAANGTAVGVTVSASDADATTNGVTFALTDDAGGRFTIDTSTGIVTVADGSLLNRESASSHDITVRATSADGSTADTTFTIQVNDVDEFNVTAPADSNAAANAVNENAANGTAVGITAAANDADATTNGVTFALTDDAGGRFTIDANTGIVTVADGSLLNRETAASHDITARATSADGSTADTTFTIQVNDVDEFDVTAPSDVTGTANAVNENAANGTAVGITASANDADATTNGVTFSLTDDAGGRFTIDTNSGVVTVADGSLLNRESASSHDITVRATSADGSTADTTFTIQVNDMDEFDVTAPSDVNAAANAVNENAANGTAVGITASANDVDATTNGVTFSLTDDAGGRFTIDTNSGVVTVADGSLLNREAAASHDITVRATSADGSIADTTFTIQVNDVDEFDVTAPSDVNAAANAVNENAINGTAVGVTASASDADATTNGVTFALTDDAGGRFTIDTSTGIVTVADGSLLNREAASSHDITVRATSADGSTADNTFTINVNDVDEFDVTAPSDVNAAANAVNENAANGTAVGITAAANDADATTNGVTFSLTDDAGGRFTIDTSTGIVTVADGSLLNREAASSHDITVRATSADGSTADNTFTINVNDVDEFDVTAPSDVNAAANAVNENAANGTAVGITAAANDADATTNGVTFALTDDAGGRFTIDANTGIVTVADGSLLNREAAASHDITVRATSADGSTADTTFTVQVNDVDEFDVTAPSDADGAANAVNENAVNGTAVGVTAAASDADATTNAITYSLDDDAGGRFAVDASSGVLRVAGNLDYESAVQHTVVVRATSADGSFALQSYTIAIHPINDLDPTIVSDGAGSSASLTVVENQLAVTQVTAVDADLPSPSLSYSLAGGVDQQFFHVDTNTGIVTFLTAPNFESPRDQNADNVYEVVVQVSDGSRTDSQQLWITVTDVNEAPLLDLDANDSSGAVGLDYRTTFVEGGTGAPLSDADLILSDPDNSTLTSLTVSLLNAPDGSQEGFAFDTSGTLLTGSYDSLTTTLTITGTDTLEHYAAVLRSVRYFNASELPDVSERRVTVVVYDGNGFSDSATAVIAIAAENDLPVVNADHYETSSGAALVVNDPGVLANDMDVDGALTVTLVQGPAHGMIQLDANGSFVYQPEAGFVGHDVFTYQVTDDRGGTALATVSVTVAPVQSAPPPGSDGGEPERSDGSASAEESEEAAHDAAAPEDTPTEPAAVADAPPPPPSPNARAEPEPTATTSSDGPTSAATGVAYCVVTEAPADAERRLADDPSNASGPFLIEPTSLAWREFAWAMQDQELWRNVDEAVAKAHSDMAWQHLSVGVVSAVSLSVSTGYVVWVLRGSFLAASLLSSVPAWACIDPLPVLSESGWKATIASWDQESLADIVSHSTSTGD